MSWAKCCGRFRGAAQKIHRDNWYTDRACTLSTRTDRKRAAETTATAVVREDVRSYIVEVMHNHQQVIYKKQLMTWYIKTEMLQTQIHTHINTHTHTHTHTHAHTYTHAHTP